METNVENEGPVILGLDLKSRAHLAFEQWKRGGGCVYLCWICQDGSSTFNGSKLLNDHLVNKHKMDLTEHRRLYGPSRVVTDDIICKLCKDSRRIVYEESHLDRHFKVKHVGTSLMEYFVNQCYAEASGLFNPLSDRERILYDWLCYGEGQKLSKESKDIKDGLHCHKDVGSDKSVKDFKVVTKTKLPLSEAKEQSIKYGEISHKVANLCRYKCSLCKFESSFPQVVARHFRRKHHNKKGHWTASRKGAICERIKTIWHMCKVCGKNILCSRQAIRKHARFMHQLNLSAYEALEDMEHIKNTQVKGTNELKENDVSSSHVSNLCQYQCKVCNFNGGSIATMINHAKTNHPEEHAVSRRANCSYMRTKVIWHVCLLCNKKIPCDRTKINFHVNVRHKTKLAQYEAKARGKTKRETFGKDSVKEEQLPNRPKRVREITTTTTQVANLCRYRCRLCNREYNNRSSMMTHARQKHPKEHAMGKRGMCTYQRIRTAWHLCRLCNKKIHCDIHTITNHAYLAHKLPMAQYVSTAAVK